MGNLPSVKSTSKSYSNKVQNIHLFPVRGLNRVQAAIYVGVSPSKFDQLVTDNRMPKPRKIDARNVWDIRELDFSFDELPQDGNHGADWDEAFDQ